MEIKPLKSFRKTLYTAPDKSITHRAIMFNSMAKGKATVTGALLGEDCLSTIECMRALGAKIEVNGDTVTIEGTDEFKRATLSVGNSGTTFRLLCGLLAGKKGIFDLDGDQSIRRRPMMRVITPITQMGGDIESVDGKAPVTVIGTDELHGIDYEMPVASAQVKSAILLAGINASGTTTVREKVKSRNHTEIMLKAMGADIVEDGLNVSVRRSTLRPVSVCVPGDISSASYPLVLGACCRDGEVTVKNVGVNETRAGIITVMRDCGVDIRVENERGEGEKVADITVKSGGKLKPIKIGEEIMPYLIDEIPVIAVLCAFIEGESVISGAHELKVKESNRIDTTVNALKAMGVDIEATDDGMIIRGGKTVKGGAVIDANGDHRIAMSLAVCGALSEKGVTLVDPECASVSYPNFYEIFKG